MELVTTFSEYFDSTNLFLDYLKFARPSDDSNDIYQYSLTILIAFTIFCNHILFAKVEN